VPGPAIGFLQEALRWWDQWLRGVDTGILDEPMLRAWLPEGGERDADGHSRGRWIAEESWPSPRVTQHSFALNPGRLDERAGSERPLEVRSPESTGSAAGSWTGFGAARDQREDDARSLVFDGAPLRDRIEILGAPVAELELACDAPVGLVVVRLCDVSPHGDSTRVSYGVLNLAHRESFEEPAPLVPGRRVRARVVLNDTAHAFAPGHRLRVAVSNRCWPLLWPPPGRAGLTLFAGASRLGLPVRPPRAGDAELRPFAPPEGAPSVEYTVLRSFPPERRVERDPRTGETVVRARFGDDGEGQVARARLDAIDLEGGDAMSFVWAIRDDDPLSARAEIAQTTELGRGDWEVRIETRIALSSSAETFRLRARLAAFEGEKRVFERSWDEEIPRDLV
jgi:predicted acyl esterase